METKEKLLTDFAISFIEEHWDEIDLNRTEITDTKEEFIDRLKSDYSFAEWIIQEVMVWGCRDSNDNRIDYLQKYEIPNLDAFTVWKIDNRYFAIDFKNNYSFKEVFPKETTVIYFE